MIRVSQVRPRYLLFHVLVYPICLTLFHLLTYSSFKRRSYTWCRALTLFPFCKLITKSYFKRKVVAFHIIKLSFLFFIQHFSRYSRWNFPSFLRQDNLSRIVISAEWAFQKSLYIFLFRCSFNSLQYQYCKLVNNNINPTSCYKQFCFKHDFIIYLACSCFNVKTFWSQFNLIWIIRYNWKHRLMTWRRRDFTFI